MVLLFSTYTNSVRCYKCGAMDTCKLLTNKSFSNDNYEIVNCEHYCWKSVYLGNIYRGCGRKRCVVSHTIGTFSTSVCCQTDFCNKSEKQSSISKYLLTILIVFVYIYL